MNKKDYLREYRKKNKDKLKAYKKRWKLLRKKDPETRAKVALTHIKKAVDILENK